MPTVAGCLRLGGDRLRRAGIEGHRRDCAILLAHAAGRDRAWLHLNRDHLLPAGIAAEFESLLARRAAGTPVPYLTGACEFFGLELRVESGIYIPKRETEGLVEEALALLDTPRNADLTWRKSPVAALVHEIGTGSGAIVIAIGRHAPRARIWAGDASPHAVALAKANAGGLGLGDRVRFRRSDLQSELPGVPDLVVANLPYIDVEAGEGLSREVRAQPRASLFSARQGLRHIARLLDGVRVAPGGHVLLEIGHDQADGVRSRCETNPKLSYERTVKDLSGLDRIAVIRAAREGAGLHSETVADSSPDGTDGDRPR